MFKRTILCLFLLILSNPSNTASINMVTLKELLEAIQNLTSELDEVDSLGDKFYKLATDNQKYLAQFAGLPDQISGLNDNINAAVPTLEKCAWILGTCMVGAAVVCIVPPAIKFFARRHRKRQERLLEEVRVQ